MKTKTISALLLITFLLAIGGRVGYGQQLQYNEIVTTPGLTIAGLLPTTATNAMLATNVVSGIALTNANLKTATASGLTTTNTILATTGGSTIFNSSQMFYDLGTGTGLFAIPMGTTNGIDFSHGLLVGGGVGTVGFASKTLYGDWSATGNLNISGTITGNTTTNLLSIIGSSDPFLPGYVCWLGDAFRYSTVFRSSFIDIDSGDLPNQFNFVETPVPHWEIFNATEGFTLATNASPDPTATFRLTDDAINNYGRTGIPVVTKVPVTINTDTNIFVNGAAIVNGTGFFSGNVSASRFVGDGSGLSGLVVHDLRPAINFFEPGAGREAFRMSWDGVDANGTVMKSFGSDIPNPFYYQDTWEAHVGFITDQSNFDTLTNAAHNSFPMVPCERENYESPNNLYGDSEHGRCSLWYGGIIGSTGYNGYKFERLNQWAQNALEKDTLFASEFSGTGYGNIILGAVRDYNAFHGIGIERNAKVFVSEVSTPYKNQFALGGSATLSTGNLVPGGATYSASGHYYLSGSMEPGVKYAWLKGANDISHDGNWGTDPGVLNPAAYTTNSTFQKNYFDVDLQGNPDQQVTAGVYIIPDGLRHETSTGYYRLGQGLGTNAVPFVDPRADGYVLTGTNGPWDGGDLTNLNASALAFGTVPASRLPGIVTIATNTAGFNRIGATNFLASGQRITLDSNNGHHWIHVWGQFTNSSTTSVYALLTNETFHSVSPLGTPQNNVAQTNGFNCTLLANGGDVVEFTNKFSPAANLGIRIDGATDETW